MTAPAKIASQNGINGVETPGNTTIKSEPRDRPQVQAGLRETFRISEPESGRPRRSDRIGPTEKTDCRLLLPMLRVSYGANGVLTRLGRFRRFPRQLSVLGINAIRPPRVFTRGFWRGSAQYFCSFRTPGYCLGKCRMVPNNLIDLFTIAFHIKT
jgi:hypothetical protein